MAILWGYGEVRGAEGTGIPRTNKREKGADEIISDAGEHTFR